MDQRVRITKEGQVIIETDNGIIENGTTTSKIEGWFHICAEDVMQILIGISDGKIAMAKSERFYYEIDSYRIIEKDSAIKEIINEYKEKLI